MTTANPLTASGAFWSATRRNIENAFEGRIPLNGEVIESVQGVIAALDAGRLRAAEPTEDGWVTNAWVKQAILLYMRSQKMELMEAGYYQAHDKIPVKRNLDNLGIRVVPPGTVRYGAFMEPGTILMPGYVNIGAYVGKGTMVDTWATVGSCAQIGQNVHLAGGVGIGGVLEPPQASPVIIEDNVFVGSRSSVTEGVVVEREAVIASGVHISASVPIIDMRGSEPTEIRGRVPSRAVVVAGVREMKGLPAGTALTSCAYIIGDRKESTDKKVSLEGALREFGISAG